MGVQADPAIFTIQAYDLVCCFDFRFQAIYSSRGSIFILLRILSGSGVYHRGPHLRFMDDGPLPIPGLCCWPAVWLRDTGYNISV